MRTTEKFWAQVDKRGPDDCWEWQGKRNAKGYGSFPWSSIKSAETIAHRFSYVQANPPRIPPGLLILHSCDNPPCCNPAHLRTGTAGQNAADKTLRGRQARGERHGLAKLTDNDVRAIRSDPRPHREICETYGIGRNRVGAIKARTAWVHVPDVPPLYQDPCK